MSTKILNEFEGGNVLVGFFSPIVLNLIFSLPAAHGLPPLDHHSVKVATM